MRSFIALCGGGLLAVLALWPLPESSPSEKAEYDRGFNEGYQLATSHGLETAQRKGVGEFYYDEGHMRMSFRWFGDAPERQAPNSPQRVGGTPESARPQAL
jgi:hypothetical protein